MSLPDRHAAGRGAPASPLDTPHISGETRHAIRTVMLDAIHREYGTAWERNNAEHQPGDEFGRGDPERWPTLNHVLDVLSEAVEAVLSGRTVTDDGR